MNVIKLARVTISGINAITGLTQETWVSDRYTWRYQHSRSQHEKYWARLHTIIDRVIMVKGSEKNDTDKLVELSKQLLIKEVVTEINTFGSYRKSILIICCLLSLLAST